MVSNDMVNAVRKDAKIGEISESLRVYCYSLSAGQSCNKNNPFFMFLDRFMPMKILVRIFQYRSFLPSGDVFFFGKVLSTLDNKTSRRSFFMVQFI